MAGVCRRTSWFLGNRSSYYGPVRTGEPQRVGEDRTYPKGGVCPSNQPAVRGPLQLPTGLRQRRRWRCHRRTTLPPEPLCSLHDTRPSRYLLDQPGADLIVSYSSTMAVWSTLENVSRETEVKGDSGNLYRSIKRAVRTQKKLRVMRESLLSTQFRGAEAAS